MFGCRGQFGASATQLAAKEENLELEFAPNLKMGAEVVMEPAAKFKIAHLKMNVKVSDQKFSVSVSVSAKIYVSVLVKINFSVSAKISVQNQK